MLHWSLGAHSNPSSAGRGWRRDATHSATRVSSRWSGTTMRGLAMLRRLYDMDGRLPHSVRPQQFHAMRERFQ